MEEKIQHLLKANTAGMNELQKKVFEENIRFIMEELDTSIHFKNIHSELNRMSQEKAHKIDLMLMKVQLGIELSNEDYMILEKS